MITNVRLSDHNPLFRYESEMQSEEKGSFLKGNISIDGPDVRSCKVIKLKVSVASNHKYGIHCNLLRIVGAHFKCEEKESDDSDSATKSKILRTMSPSCYSVTLIRDENDKLVLDTSSHKSYLPADVDDKKELISSLIWDEDQQCLKLGDGGLQLTVITPRQDARTSKHGQNDFVHKNEVVRRRYKEEHCPNYPQTCTNDFDCNECMKFLEDELNIFAKRRGYKRKDSKEIEDVDSMQSDKEEERIFKKKSQNTDCSLETFLSNDGIHKAKLKVESWLKRGEHVEKSTGYSEILLSRKIYNISIDKTCSEYLVLDNASMQSLLIVLAKLGAPKRINIQAKFVYRQKSDTTDVEIDVSPNEIKVLEIAGSSVRRVGAKGDIIQIFFTTCKGMTLALANKQNYIISIKLSLGDDDGSVDCKLDLETCHHDCAFDREIGANDELMKTFNHEFSLQRNSACSLCIFSVQIARKQYRLIQQSKQRTAQRGPKLLSSKSHISVSSQKRSHDSGYEDDKVWPSFSTSVNDFPSNNDISDAIDQEFFPNSFDQRELEGSHNSTSEFSTVAVLDSRNKHNLDNNRMLNFKDPQNIKENWEISSFTLQEGNTTSQAPNIKGSHYQPWNSVEQSSGVDHPSFPSASNHTSMIPLIATETSQPTSTYLYQNSLYPPRNDSELADMVLDLQTETGWSENRAITCQPSNHLTSQVDHDQVQTNPCIHRLKKGGWIDKIEKSDDAYEKDWCFISTDNTMEREGSIENFDGNTRKDRNRADISNEVVFKGLSVRGGKHTARDKREDGQIIDPNKHSSISNNISIHISNNSNNRSFYSPIVQKFHNSLLPTTNFIVMPTAIISCFVVAVISIIVYLVGFYYFSE